MNHTELHLVVVMEEKVEEEARASKSEPSVGLHPHGKLLSSYLGLNFSIFLALLPSSSSISQLSTLHLKLLQAEQELCHLKSRRKEDSKANARVVEIFVSHYEAWHREKKRMVNQIHAVVEEITCLRAKVAELEWSEAELKANVEELTRGVREIEEMLGEDDSTSLIKFSPTFPSIFILFSSLFF